MLILLLIIPLIGCFLMFPIEENSLFAEKRIKKIALFTSMLNLLISILMWIEFDPSSNDYQFVYEFNQLKFFHFNIGIDGTSLYFVLLTTFITPLCLLSNWKDISGKSKKEKKSGGATEPALNMGLKGTQAVENQSTAWRSQPLNEILVEPKDISITQENGLEDRKIEEGGTLKYFLMSFLILETLQIAVFVVLDLFLFYIFFESVLIPLFIVILKWGASEFKIRAAYLFFLYTFFGSLFMLLAIITIYYYIGSTDFQLISLSEISIESQKWLWCAFFLAFAVKTPIWPLNTWLIKAHVEAPLAGSILLAGTILKLATYGYLRVLLSLFPDVTNYFMPLVQTIAIISLIYASLSTIRQIDTKAVIAYSSVAHMAVVILGLFSNTIQGLEGAILLGLGHGFVSPALFVCCGGVIYNRTHSRVILYHKGLAYYMPVFTIFFLIFTLFNTGIPLSLNFVGEIMSLIGTWFRSPLIALLGATGIVLSACYSIFLYNRISYGSYSQHLSLLKDLDRREFFLLLSLLYPVLILGILPNLILTGTHFSISQLIYN